MTKFFYIYNPHQANYFVMNGVPVLEIGRGKKGDIFVKFPRNEKSNEVFDRWVMRGNEIEAN